MKNTEDSENINRDSIKKEIFEIASDIFAMPDDAFDNFEEIGLCDDCMCDTLDIVEFLMTLEDEFGVMITEDESEKIETFGDAVDTVWGKLAAENEKETSK